MSKSFREFKGNRIVLRSSRVIGKITRSTKTKISHVDLFIACVVFSIITYIKNWCRVHWENQKKKRRRCFSLARRRDVNIQIGGHEKNSNPFHSSICVWLIERIKSWHVSIFITPIWIFNSYPNNLLQYILTGQQTFGVVHAKIWLSKPQCCVRRLKSLS